MAVDHPYVLPIRACRDNAVGGGKAINLAQLLEAGFPVPDGFVVTTAAFRTCRGRLDCAEVEEAIRIAYRAMGSPVVAVRSSATAEDTAGASMAGQYETCLDLQGEAQVLASVQQCWDSIGNDRVGAYLAQHGIDRSQVAMAVVVQELVQAEVAGVMFTANPKSGRRDEMLVEASWGLGESVVSGTVQPDTLTLDHANGDVKHLAIGSKLTAIQPGSHAVMPVTEDRRAVCCLSPGDVAQLWQCGHLVERHYHAPMDIEWAISKGRLFLLQSRAITTLGEIDEQAAAFAEAKAACRSAVARGRGGWVRHNLGETLPQPTQLTWSVVSRFMSGAGGFGRLYEMVGFKPSATAKQEGILDLIGGRIYMDLARGGELFLEHYPYTYDLQLLQDNPDAAQQPPTIPKGSFREQLRVSRVLGTVAQQIRERAVECERELEQQIIPAFVAWVQAERSRDLSQLTGAELMALWRSRETRVLQDFGPWSLLPSVIAVQGIADLKSFLAIHWWDEDPAETANLLATSKEPDLTVRFNQGLFEVAAGSRSVEDWITEFGHRAAGEMELANPRWRETPKAVRELAQRLTGGSQPIDHHHHRLTKADAKAAEIRGRVPAGQRPAFDALLRQVRHHIRYREDGKHWLMLGYETLREVACETARRLDLGDEVFLLDASELERALATGFAPCGTIAARRRRRAAEAKLRLPTLIGTDAVERLDEPAAEQGGDRLKAFSISLGTGSGPARIVRDPKLASDLGKGYILICSSTDPSWTPLFVNAAGLVLECGGSLSHGAIVAREMGIPAVVLPGACSLLKNGEAIVVDGQGGAVLRSTAATAPIGPDPTDCRIDPRLVPPPVGPIERRATRLRNVGLLIWVLLLTPFYLSAFQVISPTWCYDPVMVGLDALFGPMGKALGYPWTVTLVAALLSAGLMITQRLLYDVPRLREAKRRAELLTREAQGLPVEAPRRKALMTLARPVSTRITLAAFVPLCVLLGPLMMPFQWFMDRADPGNWNAKPSVSQLVTLKVAVEGDFTGPLVIDLDPALLLDEATLDASRMTPPVRATLERLHREWSDAPAPSGLAWELTAAAEQTRQSILADLDAYLDRPLGELPLAWQIVPPDHAGRWPVTVRATGSLRITHQEHSADGRVKAVIEQHPVEQRLTAYVVLGEHQIPQLKIMRGEQFFPGVEDAAGPIRALWIDYKEPLKQNEMVFARPFDKLGWMWEAGWIWIYILAYVPVMYLMKWLLRIP